MAKKTINEKLNDSKNFPEIVKITDPRENAEKGRRTE